MWERSKDGTFQPCGTNSHWIPGGFSEDLPQTYLPAPVIVSQCRTRTNLQLVTFLRSTVPVAPSYLFSFFPLLIDAEISGAVIRQCISFERLPLPQ